MAFPTTSTVLDDFNRADAGTLGGNWSREPFNDSTTGAFQVVSNQAVKVVTSYSYEMGWWNPATYGPDCEVWVTIPTVNAAAYVYLHLRTVSPSASASTGDGYLFEQIQGTGNAIYRMDNGVSTMLGARMAVTNLSSGDKYGAEAIGSTFQAYRYTGGSWSAYGSSRTDTTYTSAGYIGFGNYDNTGSGTSAFDDFGGGTRLVAPPWPPAARRFQHLIIR